jgi:hypothetical protein
MLNASEIFGLLSQLDDQSKEIRRINRSITQQNRLEKQRRKLNRLEAIKSSDSFSIIKTFHVNVQKYFGEYDHCSLDGFDNLYMVANHCYINNVGIKELKITCNGKLIKKITFHGNYQESIPTKNESIEI